MLSCLSRELHEEKRKILDELESAKWRILHDMGGVDKETLTNLRKILAHYENVSDSLPSRTEQTIRYVNDKIPDLEKDVGYLKNYVTPQMYGAKGDGSTDDYEPILMAFNKANELKRTVYFPKSTYYISKPLIITSVPNIHMDGAIHYDGAGVALTLGKSGSTVAQRDLKIIVNGGTDGAFTQGSTGLKIINAYSCNIRFTVTGFEKCVQLIGDGKGFVYNEIHIGVLNSGIIMLELTQANGGWCNENAFYDGRFYNFSSCEYGENAIGVLISSAESYANNNNNFYNTSIEGFNPCVKIERGNYNHFINIRTEGAKIAFVTENKSRYNSMHVGYGVSAHKFDAENYISTNISKKYDVNVNICGNNAMSNDTYLIGKNLFTLKDGVLQKKIPKAIKYKDHVLLKMAGLMGVLIKKPTSNEFNFRINVDGTAGVRFVCVMFDKDGKSIDALLLHPNSYKSIQGGCPATVAGSSSAGGYFIIPDNVECDSIFLGASVFANGSPSKILGFSIISNSPITILGETNVYSESIPTCEAYNGSYVINIKENDNIKGWIYTPNGWTVNN